MNSHMPWRLSLCWLSLPLVFLIVGCRHATPRSAGGAEQVATPAGDAATNVMIVPMAAGWAARGGGTNQLPAGIRSPQAFPFPEYDQTLVKSVYARWQELLNARPQPPARGEVVVEFELH